MAGFANVREYVESIQAGRAHSCSIRKVPSQASTAGWWVDLSMAAGNPKPQYYASSPLVAATLNGFDGIFHGDAKSPARKVLTDLALCSPTAGLVGEYMLLDYLLYYPFIDLDDTDPQLFDNTVTLPRYADGAGVEAILVAVAPTLGGGGFSFEYVDQDGVTQTSPAHSLSTAAASIASVVTSEPATAAGGGLFLKKLSGTSGIRRVNSFTCSSPGGGLASLVLVKPLASIAVREVSVPSEMSYRSMRSSCAVVEDGAYLNMMMRCAATVASGTLAGRASFAWN